MDITYTQRFVERYRIVMGICSKFCHRRCSGMVIRLFTLEQKLFFLNSNTPIPHISHGLHQLVHATLTPA